MTYREDLREKYDLPEKMETIEDIENYLEVVTANEDTKAAWPTVRRSTWRGWKNTAFGNAPWGRMTPRRSPSS